MMGDGFIFTVDGVNMAALRERLNGLDRLGLGDGDAKAMAHLVSAACGYDALCAGVNQSIGNAFKEEGESKDMWDFGGHYVPEPQADGDPS